MIQIEIGEKNYQVELDLGTKLSTLSAKDLNEIDKKRYGTFSSLDMHGNAYESVVYEIFDIKVHDFFTSTMKIREESLEFLENSVAHGDVAKITCSGRIGRELFGDRNFLLDFARGKIILCKNFKDLRRDHYKLEAFTKTPFHMNKNGINFQIETDTGVKTLVLDTGSSRSAVRTSATEEALSTDSLHDVSVWHSNQFIIGACNFGPRNLCLCKISSLISDMDGLLGMDFWKEHAIYIDMGRSEAYIGKSSETAELAEK